MKTFDLKYTVSRKIANNETLTVKIRLNDECKNGHEDFSITGDTKSATGKDLTGGCIHDTIEKYYPQFKQFIDLHLSDAQGAPMYAVENGYYHLTESSKETTISYLRITEKEYNVLKGKTRYSLSDSKIYFTFLLRDLGIFARWKQEAVEARQKLEKLTAER